MTSPTVANHASVPRRDLMIDAARGMAIALVALGHTNQGIIHRGWWGTSNTGAHLNDAIYAFHMPAFFFISGVFLRQGVAKRGELGYTLEKLRTIIYPYVLWVSIFAATTIPLAGFTTTTPPGWKAFFYNLVTGNASWFLPTLFCMLMIGMLLRRLPSPLLFALSVAISYFFPRSPIAVVDGSSQHLVFLVVGMWVGSSFKRLKHIPFAASALIAVLCAVLIVWVTSRPYGAFGNAFIPIGLVGTFMLLLIARCLGQSAAARALAWAGAASFGIFLMSAFPQGGTREFLVRVLHTTSPLPQLIFPTLLAILIPAWLYHQRKPLHIQWMFIWPF